MGSRQWSEGVQKAWVCYEMFRRLGFRGDQISYGPVKGIAYGMIARVVRVQIEVDGKVFGIHAALWPRTDNEFHDEWNAFGDGLVSTDPTTRIPESELKEMYSKHSREYDPSALVAAITQKGIDIPGAQD